MGRGRGKTARVGQIRKLLMERRKKRGRGKALSRGPRSAERGASGLNT